MQTTIVGNLLFNGPRAGINHDDGFGGGNNISDNALFNWCRDSGDREARTSIDTMQHAAALEKPSRSHPTCAVLSTDGPFNSAQHRHK